MPQALIKINAVVGSNTDLPINTIVQLDNQNIGGELTYEWAIVDQPPGSADTLSSTGIQNPTFTPKKEGTYLIRLIVNTSLPDEQQNKVVGAVLQLKTRERIIAAGETTEADSSDGWATANNSYLRRMDAILSDSHVMVGANTSGSTRAAGEIVRVTSLFTLKATLPGQEKIPGFSLSTAAVLGQVDELLGIVERNVNGSPSIPNNELMLVKFLGSPRDVSNVPLSFSGSASVGDSVFLSDTGFPSLIAGTTRRQIGSVAAIPSAGQYNVWFNGVGGADITPIDRRYVVHGNPGTLSDAVRVDGSNATGITGTPFRIKAGDTSTVAFQVQAFAGGQDIQQWLDSSAGVTWRVDNSGNIVTQSAIATIKWQNAGPTDVIVLSKTGMTATGSPFKIIAGNTSTVPLQVQAFASGQDMLQWLDSGGGITWRVDNSGHLVTQSLTVALKFQSAGPTDVVTMTRTALTSTTTYDLIGGSPTGKLTIGNSTFRGIQIGTTANNNKIDIAVDSITGTSAVHTIGVSTSAGTLTDGDLRLVTYDGNIFIVPSNAGSIVPTWQFKKTGELSGAGGNRKIENVLDPTVDQDAATKNYVDRVSERFVHENYIINGAFDFWQRSGGFTDALLASSSGPTSVRQYSPDRWACLSVVQAGSGSVQLAVARTSSPSGAHSRYWGSFAVTVGGGVTQWDVEWVQEIDRDWIYSMRGKTATIQFKARRASGPSTPVMAISLISGNGFETDNLHITGYTNPVFHIFQLATISSSSSTTFTFTTTTPIASDARTLVLRFQMYDVPNPGYSFSTIEMGEIILATSNNVSPDEYKYAAGDYENEFSLCQRYYEKSYLLDVVPGTNTGHGETKRAIARFAAGSYGLSPEVRFNVAKRVTPTIDIYSPPIGTLGSVFFDVPSIDVALTPGTINTRGFAFDFVPLNSAVGDIGRFHWTAESEI